MAEITDNDVLTQLERFANATCLIETDEYKGTGFHFGAGWIMSVGHNFQDNNKDPAFHHSLLRQAKFTFFLGERPIVFLPQANRTAFIHHLQPGQHIDKRNKDIAMVKLGTQTQYARSSRDDWENLEDNNLTELDLTGFGTLGERVVEQNEEMYAIHYGGDDNNRKVVRQIAIPVTPPNAFRYPTLQLSPPVPPGASGCPILNNRWQLVGLLFGGNNVNNNALMWDDGIHKYINHGVKIIPDCESYMALRRMANGDTAMNTAMNAALQDKAAQERHRLVQLARDNRLTIYLMNGEIITGQQN